MKLHAGLVVRGLRAAAVFSAFAAYALSSSMLFESHSTVNLEGSPALSLSAYARDSKRAQGFSRAAAERTVARANVVLAPPGEGDVAQRDEAFDRLVAFVVAHPELAASAAPVPPPRTQRAETERIRLVRERERIQAELEGLQRGAAPVRARSDNPFDEGPALPSTTLLKRRLSEIDSSLAALERAPSAPSPSGALGELDALVRALPSAVPSVAPAPAHAKVAVPASRPSALEPDRFALLALGLFAALAAATLPTTRRQLAATSRAPWPVSPSLAPVAVAQVPLGVAPTLLQTPSRAPSPPVLAEPLPAPRSEPPPPLRPRSTPPGESPVMAYPTPWRPDSVPDRARYAELRDELRALGEADCFVIAITATPGAANAKADVAAGLAACFADDEEARVLLVEADLGRPSLQKALGVAVLATTDFATQLERRVQGSPDAHWYVLKCSAALHVLASAREAPDLVLSTHFEECLLALRPFYDVIIVHAPALSEVVFGRAVSDVVDGVVIAHPADDPAAGSTPTPYSGKRLTVVLPIASA